MRDLGDAMLAMPPPRCPPSPLPPTANPYSPPCYLRDFAPACVHPLVVRSHSPRVFRVEYVSFRTISPLEFTSLRFFESRDSLRLGDFLIVFEVGLGWVDVPTSQRDTINSNRRLNFVPVDPSGQPEGNRRRFFFARRSIFAKKVKTWNVTRESERGQK